MLCTYRYVYCKICFIHPYHNDRSMVSLISSLHTLGLSLSPRENCFFSAYIRLPGTDRGTEPHTHKHTYMHVYTERKIDDTMMK